METERTLKALFGMDLKITQNPFFRKYLLPGIIFQSVVIAGGYGTGREIVEFFLSFGPGGGLLAMLISTVMWSVICAATFEFSRAFRAYEYRTFFKYLLGRLWFLFEILYIIYLMIILAVIASAAGHILEETLGWNYYVGVIGMMIGTGILVFMGSKTIENILSFWSLYLYVIFIVFVTLAFAGFGDKIIAGLEAWQVEDGWVVGGFQYAFYNMGVIPVVLFATRDIKTKKEAYWSGGLAGIIGMIPALMVYLSFIGQYPQIVGETVPANYMLVLFRSPLFQFAFQLMLFGTLIESSTGCLHAVNDRIDATFRQGELTMPRWLRPAVATLLLILGAAIAQFGLVNLIAQGYGTIAWGFMAVFIIPVLTIGVWKSYRMVKVEP